MAAVAISEAAMAAVRISEAMVAAMAASMATLGAALAALQDPERPGPCGAGATTLRSVLATPHERGCYNMSEGVSALSALE